MDDLRRRGFALLPFAALAALAGCAPTPMLGPSGADVRPGPRPVDVRVFGEIASPFDRKDAREAAPSLWRMQRVLPPPTTFSALVIALNADGIETRDLGFDVSIRTAYVGGGHTGCCFRALAVGDTMLSLRVQCSSHADAESLPLLKRELDVFYAPAFKRALRLVDARYETELRYEYPHAGPGAPSVRAQLDRALGPLVAVDVDAMSPAVLNAYATLMSPFIEHTIGQECGDFGVDPEGRESTLTLQADGRTDLLRNVLRGPNPEARLYAARALADMHALGPDDAKVIRTLGASRLELSTCKACTFSNVSSGALFLVEPQ